VTSRSGCRSPLLGGFRGFPQSLQQISGNDLEIDWNCILIAYHLRSRFYNDHLGTWHSTFQYDVGLIINIYNLKSRSKAVPYTPWRRYRKEEVLGLLLLILDLGTRWGWVVSVTPRPRFTPGRDPRYPLDTGWVGARSDLDIEAGEKSSLPLPGSNPDRAVCSQTLYWQSCPRSYLKLK
jgi:hypothetical protein